MGWVMSRRVSLAAALLLACADDGLNSVPEPDKVTTGVPTTCQTGAVTGHICNTSGLPLEGAEVYISATDCNGVTRRYTAESSETGAFAIANVPAGNLDLVIDHPSRTETIPVRIVPGEILTVDEDAGGAPLCDNPPPPRVAVITGSWDEVDVLLDSLAIPYDLYDGDSYDSEANALLSSLAAMSEYDVIFVNCGSMYRDFLATEGSDDYYYYSDTVTFDFNAVTYQNLRQYVQNGGSVYASDWAWPIIEGLKADAIDFYGDEGQNGSEATTGVEGSTEGEIMDAALESFLGQDTVQIDFDLAIWAVIDGVSVGSDVYVRGPVSIYSDPYGWDTTNIGVKPLLVGMRPFTGGGYVIYTTFHYHSQPSAEMLDVLRYLIFQL